MKRIFGLVPNVFFLGLVSLLNDLSSEMIFSVMPVFLTTVLGAPALFLGFLEGFADALASVLRIFSGWWSDKIARRKSIAVAGYTISTLTRGVLAVVTNFWQAFVLRAIDRVGKGVREAPRDALLASSVESHEVGFSFGYHRAMDTIGGILGPVLAIFLLPILGGNFRTLFLISFGFGFLTLLTFFFVKEVHPYTKRESTSSVEYGESNSRFGAGILGAPRISPDGARLTRQLNFSLAHLGVRFRQYLLSVFLFGLGVMPISLMLLIAKDLAFGAGTIPVMYLIYSVSFMIFAVPFGRLSDKIGEVKVIIGGFLAAILAYLILAAFPTLLGVALGFIVFGLYSAMTDGIHRALTSKLVPKEHLAGGQGFIGAAIGFSSLLAGVVGGVLWDAVSPGAAFAYGGACMIVGLFMLLVTFDRGLKTT